jgi:hypothetical protein
MRRTLFRLVCIIFLADGCKDKRPLEPVRTSQVDGAVTAPKPEERNQAHLGNRPAASARDVGARTLDSFLVESGVAGPFENGMNVNDVYAISVPGGYKLVDLQSEGNFTPALQIRLAVEQKEPALVASIYWICSRFSVYGISVRDARYRTREGLGVGSTLGELKRYLKIDLPWEQSEEGDLVAITPGLSFAFAYSETLTDEAKVKTIWVYPDDDKIEKRWCP